MFLAISNSILAFRTSPFIIPVTVAILLMYPMGVAFASILPHKSLHFYKFKIDLNPGPFSIKEHVIASIIASAGGGVAYGVDNVVVMKFHHFMGNQNVNIWNSLAFVISVQLMGFGVAGLLRRFLVKPLGMYWPSTLSWIALFIGFHERQSYETTRYSRYQWFWIVSLLIFFYTWIPEYFFTALQSIAWLCFFTEHPKIQFLASSTRNHGVGLFSLSLDWAYLNGNLLTTPFWASFHIFIANVVWLWILTPILYFSNAFGADLSLKSPNFKNAQNYTINSNQLFDRNGYSFNPILLLNNSTFVLDEEMYQEKQPVYISTLFAVTYAQGFMAISSAFTFVFLWYGSSIKKQIICAFKQLQNETDIHNQLMDSYPDVPDWIFLIFLFVMLGIQVLVSLFTPFQMPIWSILLCVIMSFVFLLPIGVIFAISGIQLGLNVLTELVIGLLIPGQTVAVLAFRSLGTNLIIQAIALLSDLKIGHYMKIAPLSVVICQLYGTLLGAILNTCVTMWAETGLSTLLYTDIWNATEYSIFYSAGAIWGAIGPRRFFGSESVYHSLLWAFAIGLCLPWIPWICNRFAPSSFWSKINIPLLSIGNVKPGAIQNATLSSIIVAWFFQYYLFHYHHSWWEDYNYITAAALDIGTALASLAIVGLHLLGLEFSWPGNPEILDFYCLKGQWMNSLH